MALVIANGPSVALAPVHAPLAVQVAALVACQLNVTDVPKSIAAGEAVSVSVGALMLTAAVWLAEPPGPVQVRT